MALETADLSNYAAALETFFGANDLNPNDVRNTCVSVALAYMDNHRDIEELWRAVRPGQLIPDKGLSFRDALGLMQLTGWQYKWVRFRSSGTRQTWAYEDLVRYLSTNHPPYPDTFMVLYKRPSGRGHAINLEYWTERFKFPEDAFRKREWHEYWHFRDFSVTGPRASEEAVKNDIKPATEIHILTRGHAVPGKDAGELYDQWRERGRQIGRVVPLDI